MTKYVIGAGFALRAIIAVAVLLMLFSISHAAEPAAAEKPDPKILLRQAAMYLHGHGVAADPRRALAFYREAAEQDIAFAQFRLARLLLDGDRVPRDLERGLAWLRRAAGLGFVDAQLELSRLYQAGELVQSDHVAAYKWLHIADSLTERELDDRRESLEAEMSFLQLTRARYLARRCIYRGYRGC